MTFQSCRVLVVLTIGLCALPAFSDVTINQKTRIEGVGLMKFMNMSIHSETSVASDRSRTETQLNADSRMVRMFAGKGTTEIVRLDLDTVYTLEPDKKRYSEVSLAQQRIVLLMGLFSECAEYRFRDSGRKKAAHPG